MEDVNTRQRLSFSFPELLYTLLEFNSGKKLPTFDELNEMAGISAIKFETARLHFVSDVFVAVAVLVA